MPFALGRQRRVFDLYIMRALEYLSFAASIVSIARLMFDKTVMFKVLSLLPS